MSGKFFFISEKDDAKMILEQSHINCFKISLQKKSIPKVFAIAFQETQNWRAKLKVTQLLLSFVNYATFLSVVVTTSFKCTQIQKEEEELCEKIDNR